MHSFLTEEDHDLMNCHYSWVNQISSEDALKYSDDCNQAPITAIYLANNSYFHREHLIECIILDATVKGTRYEGNAKLYFALSDKSLGEHTIQVNTSYYEDCKIVEDIQAYHLSATDLEMMNLFLDMEHRYGDTSEGSEYELKTYSNVDDIELYHCYASEYISSNDTIKGNRYSEDCDTYGSQFGSKAQDNYIFWNVDTKEYIVIHHSYWCL